MAVTWEAAYLPASSNNYDPSQGGFLTREAAWEYVATRLCPDCVQELRGDHGDVDLEYPEVTACGAEWAVWEEEDEA